LNIELHSKVVCKVNLSIILQAVIALLHNSFEWRINMKENREKNKDNTIPNANVNSEGKENNNTVMDELMDKSNYVLNDDFEYKGSDYNYIKNRIDYNRGLYSNDIVLEKAGVNLSWKSIFAGLLTFLALSILFSLISATIGL